MVHYTKRLKSKFPDEGSNHMPYEKLDEYLQQYLDVLVEFISNPLEFPPDYTSPGGNHFYAYKSIVDRFNQRFPDAKATALSKSLAVRRLKALGWIISTGDKYVTLNAHAKRFFQQNPVTK